MSEQSVFQAGDFNYEECSLLSSSGVSYPDFEKQVVSIILFENIFKLKKQMIDKNIDNLEDFLKLIDCSNEKV